MISRTSRAGSGEAIYAGRPDGVVCTETASVEDTSPETAVLSPTPDSAREKRTGRLLELELTSSSRSSSIYSLSHSQSVQNNNQQGRKEEKAAANGPAGILVEDAWVLSPIGAVGAPLFVPPCCNFQHGIVETVGCSR